MQITYSHIKQIKRTAKELKRTNPEFKLGQLQNLAATQLGLRDWHEAVRLYDTWLLSQVHESDKGVGKCSLCEFSFVVDLKEDRKAHREIHERFHEASEFLRYIPGNYTQRELMKQEGRAKALSDADLETRLDGLLMLVRGWFDRSLSKAIYGDYWRKHPAFEEYLSMIQDTLPDHYAELTAVLKTRYGYRPGEITAGESHWYPQSR
jgi:hypothetical protein